MEEEQQQLQRVRERVAVSIVLTPVTCPLWDMPTRSNDHPPRKVDSQAYEPDTHTKSRQGRTEAHREKFTKPSEDEDRKAPRALCRPRVVIEVIRAGGRW